MMNNEGIHKLNMKSKDIIKDNINKISELFPSCISEGKINFDMLKQELSNEIIEDGKERYQLTWAGKKEATVNTYTQCNNTLRPIKEKSVDFDNTKNIYIEGNNLDALKILQESYLNKIKCIYIDPPYNTGKDFIYSDNFNKTVNAELLDNGFKDEKNNRLISNPQSYSRFHSAWLSMIYSRIKLARNLLNDSGVIFISIGNDEIGNLRKIVDEIFGENNFIAQLVWTNNEGGGSSDSKFFKVKHEYILCYAKNIEKTEEIKKVPIEDTNRYKLTDEYVKTRGKYQLVKLASASLQYSSSLDYPIKNPEGNDVWPRDNTDKDRAIWRWGKDKLNWGFENNFLEWKKDKNGVWQLYTKQYTNCDKDGNLVERTKIPLGIIDKYSSTQGSNELFELFKCKIFEYPKPTELIKYLIERFANNDDDIIMDFFSGSATTADAILQLNEKDEIRRRFILVQVEENCEIDSEAYKNGYNTICDIGEERIKKAGEKIKKEEEANIDYGFRVYKIDSSNMKDVYYTPTDLKQSQLNMFESNIKEDRTPEDLLTQVILELGLTLDLSIKERKILNNNVYFVENNSLVACFDDTIDINIIDEICKCNPLKIVFKESSFRTDSDKINTCERIMKLSSDTEINII